MRENIYSPCGSAQHTVGRRQFMGDFLTAAGAISAGTSLFSHPLGAGEIARRGKSVVVVFLNGGVSQFESWDPKKDLDTGGPFKAIPTSVPGIHISELLPNTAKQMHHMALIRSINSGLDDHGLANNIIRTGRTTRSATEYPELGSVVAKGLERPDYPLPGHIATMLSGVGGRANNAAYLGHGYASVNIGAEKGGVVNTQLPDGMSVTLDSRRHDWRRFANNRFGAKARSAEIDAYTQSYEQALRLMERREVFDISKETEAIQIDYGKTEFGKQLLLARRLVEQEVPFVEIQHGGWDFHHNNFEFHLHYVGDFDRPFAHFIADLDRRGLLQQTLVIVMTEFGRTPRINTGHGRDHYAKAWSIALAGCGIQHGAVIGKTDAKGVEVTHRQIDHRHLFHTYLRAVGIDSSAEFEIAGRKFPIADPAYGPIEELLA